MRLTYDDFLLFPDDGKRHEIIDGVHYVTPSPRLRHQDLVGRLHFECQLSLREHRAAGRMFVGPLDVVLSHYDVVEPDLLFIARDQAGIMTERNIQGAPALVVEVMSKSTRKRDAQIKRRLFEQVGVREYWLVDPELNTVQVFRPTAEPTALAAPVSRDADDDVVLATAVAAQATVIVTGDLDLLVLRRYGGIDIVTPHDFLIRLPSAPT